MQAQTIDEVISFLKTIIKESEENNDPMGYFAALYLKVTIKVKEGIAQQNFFDDNKRMEQLDVIFANRYLEAYTSYKNNTPLSSCWLVAFKATHKFWPIVLQHLLLGMNAHINLDLGIAAAQVAPGKSIYSLHNDFNKINTILANLVGQVEHELSTIWPTLKWILKLSKKLDSFLINFSMELARDGAWKFATELAPLNSNDQHTLILDRDKKVAKIADLIIHPGWIASTLFKIIRLGERGSVSEKIKILNSQMK